MASCSFCGNAFPKGTGKIYVKTDGKIFNFCSMKCEKNMIILRRKPRTTKWTKEYADVKAGLLSGEENKENKAESKGNAHPAAKGKPSEKAGKKQE